LHEGKHVEFQTKKEGCDDRNTISRIENQETVLSELETVLCMCHQPEHGRMDTVNPKGLVDKGIVHQPRFIFRTTGESGTNALDQA